ncbi:MAG TPA: GMC family oxidoreductase [Arsenicitalea sp.]|nr:GMC family oxidoreductase [Arsenicitalea sp.]
MSSEYDCIVVGAGAAGTIMAALMAESGKRTLLLERGRRQSYATHGRRDHLRNQRLHEYGHNAGPDIDGNPRVVVGADGAEQIVRPHEPGYNNNAAVVGGGTLVYGGMAWRFLPDDFRMATRYGTPAGSSLVDWPISYEDLEPFYERAEWEIGASGDGKGNRQQGPRARAYPMPAVPAGSTTQVLRGGAEALGMGTFTPPLLINSVPRAGRDACIQCGSCVGFPCPSDGKNGTQNTMLPRALASGACELVTGAMVELVNTDEQGKVTGVTFVVETEDGKSFHRTATAKVVVLSAGAIETARLLLLSRSRIHPRGLGNEHGQVGRNLQGHYYPTAFGLFEDKVYDPRGPGVTIATCDFNHGNDGFVGGGMLADDFVMLPIIFWKTALPPELPRWGTEAKAFMRNNYSRVVQVKGPVHEIPNPDCRVELDGQVTDRFGLPVARLSGVAHAETVRTASYILGKAKQWVEASGATKVWGAEPVARLSGGQHQAGTCRMGEEPDQSVTDKWGRVWGHDNLFVSDGSLHPTNGGFNPVLTIMAMAFRNGEHLASQF